jgi:hypothetical protein
MNLLTMPCKTMISPSSFLVVAKNNSSELAGLQEYPIDSTDEQTINPPPKSQTWGMTFTLIIR